MNEESLLAKKRKKPICPEKLVIPERDPNEKPMNWLRASDTKSASAKRLAARRRRFFKIYLFFLFTTIAILVISGIIGAFIFFFVKHDLLTPTGTVLKRLEGHDTTIHSLVFSPDGKYLLSGSAGKVAFLWDVKTGAVIRQLRGHRASVTAVAFGKESTLDPAGHSETFSPSQELDILTRAMMEKPKTEDGQDDLKKYMVVTASEDMYAFKWNISDNPPYPAIRFGDSMQQKIIPSLQGIHASLPENDTPLELQEKPPIGHKKTVYCVAVSENGYYVLTGSEDGTAILWNAENGSRYNVLSFPDSPVYAVALDPADVSFATGGMDRYIRVWGLNSDKLLFSLDGHNGPITVLTYSPNGKLLLSGSQDHSAILWNSTSGYLLQRFEAQVPINGAAVNSTGEYVLTNMLEDSAVLWNANSGQKVAQFITGSPILALAMSPEEDENHIPKYIAVATAEKQIIIFTVPKMK